MGRPRSPMPTEKLCTRCDTVKPVDEFYKNSSRNGRPATWCKECRREWQAQRRREKPYTWRDWNLVTTYGLTPSDYEAMRVTQDHLCAACGRPESAVRNGRIQALSVDHDHDTGRVRALLCSNCNTALGLLGDDFVRILALAAYRITHEGAVPVSL